MHTRRVKFTNHQYHVMLKQMLFSIILDVALLQLVEELHKRGLFKQETKRTIRRIQLRTQGATTLLPDVFGGINSDMFNDLNSRAWYIFKEIENHVGFEGVEKWVNIVCSLSRHIKKCGDELRGQSQFLLHDLERELQCLGIETNKVVDVIIDKIDIKVDIT